MRSGTYTGVVESSVTPFGITSRRAEFCRPRWPTDLFVPLGNASNPTYEVLSLVCAEF